MAVLDSNYINALWASIQAFHPDKPGVALPFSRRLSIENGWTMRFSIRAIEEYKKFIFLACIADHPVTPSEEVDQVWHLHLTYSNSYWDDFCGKILNQPVHHIPTEGGNPENEKYFRQYAQTLELYQRQFGATPPADIWPPVAQRFKGGLWRWVNRHKYWIIPKLAYIRTFIS